MVCSDKSKIRKCIQLAVPENKAKQYTLAAGRAMNGNRHLEPYKCKIWSVLIIIIFHFAILLCHTFLLTYEAQWAHG